MKVRLESKQLKKCNLKRKKKGTKKQKRKFKKLNKIYPSDILLNQETEETIPCCFMCLMLCFFGMF